MLKRNWIQGWYVWLLALLLASSVVMAEPPAATAPPATTDAAAFDFGDEGLSPEQAFAFGKPRWEGDKLYLSWVVAPNHYLYKDRFIVKTHQVNGVVVGEAQLPDGKKKTDEFFGNIEALYEYAEIVIPLKLTDANQPGNFVLELGWRGCEEGRICYPEELQAFKVGVAAPAALTWEATSVPVAQTTAAAPTEPVPEQDAIAQRLASGNTMLTLLGFLGFGLLLAFTPCVFPMIPILSWIIVGQKNLTPRKAFVLSLVYVLAMAVTYTIAGVLAGVFGQNLQATFQNVWVLAGFSAIFVLLALSMFGFYELQMPSAIQSRLNNLSNRQEGGNLVGVAVMGMLSALIVGPCVAAPLAGALIYIGNTGDALLGGMALFALSIGMGIPLLLVGTSAGKWLPRAGGWMEAIKAVFGVMLLGVAIWLLERVLPSSVSLLLWAALLVLSAIFLGALTPLTTESTGWRKLWKGVGILVLVYGCLVLVGSTTGKGELWQPLRGFGAGNAATESTALPFRTVTTLDAVNEALADAKGQTVMLDFYADWCVTCKEMEKYTFSDPAVQAQLRTAVLLKADVSKTTPESKALLQHFKISGPPAIVFFSKDGQELRQYRQVGFMPAAAFAAHLDKVLK